MTALANPINTDLIGEAMNNSNIIDLLDVISNIQSFNKSLEGIEIISYYSDHQITAKELYPCLLQIRLNIEKETERLSILIAETLKESIS